MKRERRIAELGRGELHRHRRAGGLEQDRILNPLHVGSRARACQQSKLRMVVCEGDSASAGLQLNCAAGRVEHRYIQCPRLRVIGQSSGGIAGSRVGKGVNRVHECELICLSGCQSGNALGNSPHTVACWILD